MFPMEFDRKVLDNLPLPDKETVDRVAKILRAIALGRVFPYFRDKRVVDSTLIRAVSKGFQVRRLSDDDGLVHTISLVLPQEDEWVLYVHERVFDYFAFVIPSHPDSRLGGRSTEEKKVLAFAEFMLRHEIEHILYPDKTERGVIGSDVDFAMQRREKDPTYYKMLRNALTDQLTGLKGQVYVEIFDCAEQERPYEHIITRLLTTLVTDLLEIPEELLRGLFPVLDPDLKLKILGEYYRRSRETAYSLTRRSSYIRRVTELFNLVFRQDEKQARDIFYAFRDRWGLIFLFQELDLSESVLEENEQGEIFTYFKAYLNKHYGDADRPASSVRKIPDTTAREQTPPSKSLKDRIEEVRSDPNFPRQAIEIIDKNRTAALGFSGPKYTELIETLLAIPWGKIHPITVDPKAFEEGLEHSHYGLHKPKEILCDFFTNLIWRYGQAEHRKEGGLSRTGSAFLFVGPPGVGKTSLAISAARNLGIPYHKISLGGMRDEADLRGHGFTYEGSKPGAIVQGLIKMGTMNGMFIMDEADKTEKFAISTLLEILDPEQNHLFHDKYTETTIDIDLSHCHFILTANTLETVPPAVINRCEVIFMDPYSVEEKVVIALRYLVKRVRRRYGISEDQIFFDREREEELIRYLIKTYTYEPGVRELERIIRTLFLRIFRKEILLRGQERVRINRAIIKQYLEPPRSPLRINQEDRVGEALALGVNLERGIGSIIPIQATYIRIPGEKEGRSGGHLSMVHATGNIQRIMDESRKVAMTGILDCAGLLGIDPRGLETPIHLHFMGASTQKDGPSAGGAIALALASLLAGRPVRRDVAMTGEIDTHGRIREVGGIGLKLESACDAGCKTMIIPKENLYGNEGVESLHEALKRELQILTYEDWKEEHEPFDYERHILQVVAVEHISEAADVSFIDEEEIRAIQERFVSSALCMADDLIEIRKKAGSCVRLIKDPDEIGPECMEEPHWKGCESILLMRPTIRKDLLDRFPLLEDYTVFRDFDPGKTEIRSVIREVKQICLDKGVAEGRTSVVAPFYLLTENGPIDQGLGIKVFANNYAIQGIKLKRCKPWLNRIYYYLSHMSPEELESFFLLGRLAGVYVIDLGFIPEKYRLDINRAEDILNGCLKSWLAVLEESLRGRESQQAPVPNSNVS